MPATINGGGDILARGGARATFRSPNVSKKKYNEATEDFDLKAFLKKDTQAGVRGEKEQTRKG
jgi:hypothetical protein